LKFWRLYTFKHPRYLKGPFCGNLFCHIAIKSIHHTHPTYVMRLKPIESQIPVYYREIKKITSLFARHTVVKIRDCVLPLLDNFEYRKPTFKWLATIFEKISGRLWQYVFWSKIGNDIICTVHRNSKKKSSLRI
jgi:hypothetical protein